jgi:6-phosphogluconolactonase
MAPPADVVYVGTYTRLGQSKGTYVYRRDPATGRLTQQSFVEDTDPSWLSFDPTKRFLFAASEGREGTGTVSSWAIDERTGDLTFLSRQPTSGGEPCHMCTDAAGRFLMVANHEDGSVAVLPIDRDGKLGPLTDLRRHEGSGPGPSQKGPHAHFVTFDPAGKRILVADKGIDKVMLYQLDEARGALVPADPPFGRLHAGAAPRHIAWHPNGRYLYVNGEADMTVTAFMYDAERGALEELHYLSTLPAGATGERFSTAQLLVHPSGRFLYVANRGHDSIAIFAIDQATGRLTAIGHEPSQGRTPRNFNIDPTGSLMYVANQNGGTIVHFRIDQSTGTLTPTGDVTEISGPVCIQFA